MESAPFLLLDDARPGRERLALYRTPARIVCAHTAEEVPAALAAIAEGLARGYHAAGYAAYELGYVLEPALRPLLPPDRAVPLLWFGLFPPPEVMTGAACDAFLAEAAPGRAYCGPLRPAESAGSYAARFAAVKDFIAAGDVYQVNFTFPAAFAFLGDPLALYRRMRWRGGAGHGAYLSDGARSVLSFSPELFFSVADGVLTARPMKGTAARGATADADAALAAGLAASEKDRAENLMIVDLIRNDVGRVAKTARVRVENAFAVETYPTVHQMVSTVRADLRPDTGPAEILRAMFPCGSVTGAPKIRAMEIVRALEKVPRGLYCGAIGVFRPDGSADFNVAIRTLTIAGPTGTLGIGGGVVADSQTDAEYEEALLKARFYSESRHPITLIETLRHSPDGGLVRGSAHLDRLEASAAALGFACDRTAACAALERAGGKIAGDARLRLELAEDGHIAVEAAALPPADGTVWRYALSERRVQPDALSRHKTGWRTFYDTELAALAAATGCDEVLFLNPAGEVVEGSRTNVFVGRGDTLLTPPLARGALNGVLRRTLLDGGACREAVLYPSDLENGDVYLGNSLRGLIRAIPARTSRSVA